MKIIFSLITLFCLVSNIRAQSIEKLKPSFLDGLQFRVDPSITEWMKKIENETEEDRRKEREKLDYESKKMGLEVTKEDLEDLLNSGKFDSQVQDKEQLSVLIRFLRNSLEENEPLKLLTKEDLVNLKKAYHNPLLTGVADDKGGIPFIRFLNIDTFLILFDQMAMNCLVFQEVGDLFHQLLKEHDLKKSGFKIDKYVHLNNCLFQFLPDPQKDHHHYEDYCKMTKSVIQQLEDQLGPILRGK